MLRVNFRCAHACRSLCRQGSNNFRESMFAACSNACFSIGGSAFPLRSARRRIPMHAFALKENLGGTFTVSKTSDNEHTSPALRDGTGMPVCSAPLSVQDPVGPPIPQFPQRPEEGTKVPSASR